MLKVTNIASHSHVGSQALGEVSHRLVDMFLWQHCQSQMVFRAAFNSSVVLGFGWSLWCFSSMTPQN